MHIGLEDQDKSGWDDSMTIVKSMKGSIDYTGAAELEYLGPTRYISDYESKIQAIYDNTATLQKSFWSAWYVYASCTDWKNSCSSRKLAYTYNLDYKTGLIEQPNDPSSTVKITFCDDYFTEPRLSKVIKAGQGRSTTNANKWDLYQYRNKGSAVLHEMMHGDAITFTANGKRHIKDCQMGMRPIESELPEKYRTPWRYRRVYGPMFTKILARIDDRQVGSWTTANTENLASYDLD